MSLGVQHDLIEREDIIRAKQQVKVLERLGLSKSENLVHSQK